MQQRCAIRCAAWPDADVYAYAYGHTDEDSYSDTDRTDEHTVTDTDEHAYSADFYSDEHSNSDTDITVTRTTPMKPQQTLSDMALAVQRGQLDISTLSDSVRAKIRRLGPIAMGGESVKDSPAPLRSHVGPPIRRAHST